MSSPAPTAPLVGPTGEPMTDQDGLLLQHYRTFAAVYNSFNRTYRWTRDEAIRHSREAALAMRRDVFLMGCLFERKVATAQTPWHLEPEDAKDPAQKEVADGLTRIVKATPHWQRFCMTTLEATWYGVYGAQLVWGKAAVGGKPALCVRRHVPVNGDKIQFDWDGTPKILVSPMHREALQKQGAHVEIGEQSTQLVLDTPAWRERFVIHQHETDDADYFDGEMAGAVNGVGIRSRIYWACWLRDQMLSWAVDYMNKVGTLGLFIVPFPAGSASGETAAKALAAAASEKNALAMPVPEGQDPSKYAPFLLAPNTAGIEALQRMIAEYFERHIERYMIGQSMSDGKDSDGSLGGSGKAKFAQNTKYNLVKFDAINLQETLTTDLVAVAQKWNYPNATFPVRLVFDLPDPEAADKLEAAKTIFDMGIEVKVDEIRGWAGASKPTEDDEVVQMGPGADPAAAGGGSPAGGGNDGKPEDAGPPVREVESFAGDAGPVTYADEGDGHWVTMGAKGGEGDKHGGTPVFIQGGKIVKGPKGLIDKSLKEHQQARGEQATKQARQADELHAANVGALKAKAEGKPEAPRPRGEKGEHPAPPGTDLGNGLHEHEGRYLVRPDRLGDAERVAAELDAAAQKQGKGKKQQAEAKIATETASDIRSQVADFRAGTLPQSHADAHQEAAERLERQARSHLVGLEARERIIKDARPKFEALRQFVEEHGYFPMPGTMGRPPMKLRGSPDELMRLDTDGTVRVWSGGRIKGQNDPRYWVALTGDLLDAAHSTVDGQDAATPDPADASPPAREVAETNPLREQLHARMLETGAVLPAGAETPTTGKRWSEAEFERRQRVAKAMTPVKYEQEGDGGEPPAREAEVSVSYGQGDQDMAGGQTIVLRIPAPQITVTPHVGGLTREDLMDAAKELAEAVKPPEQPAPVVNVEVKVPEQAPPTVTVNVPEQPAPVVNVAAPHVTVEAPERKTQRVVFERDRDGNAKSARLESE